MQGGAASHPLKGKRWCIQSVELIRMSVCEVMRHPKGDDNAGSDEGFEEKNKHAEGLEKKKQ